jgi:hypothetical protein
MAWLSNRSKKASFDHPLVEGHPPFVPTTEVFAMSRPRFASLARLVSLPLVVSLLVACGGSVEIGDDDEPSGAQGGAGGTADATSSSSSDLGGGDPGQGGAGGGGGDGGGGGQVDPHCEGLRDVFLGGMEVVDASGDGVWSPGERAVVWVTLGISNPEGFFSYPGVRVSTTNPYVVPVGDPSSFLFGITPETPATLPIELEAMDVLEPGTTFVIEAVVTSLPGDCTDTAYDYVTVTLEAPPARD